MARGSRKYRLIIYQYMLNRWWPVTLLMSVFIFLNVAVLWGAEWYFIDPTQNPLPTISSSSGTVMLAIGGICFLFSLFLVFMRKRAYVQLFDDHLRLVTPFLRLNISYKRIQRSTTAQLYSLFPPKSLSSWNRDLIAPISNGTVVVVYFTAYPLSRSILRIFLSPFFFYDKTTHIIFLLDDWMGFNTELDSRRVSAKPAHAHVSAKSKVLSGLLDDLKRK